MQRRPELIPSRGSGVIWEWLAPVCGLACAHRYDAVIVQGDESGITSASSAPMEHDRTPNWEVQSGIGTRFTGYIANIMHSPSVTTIYR